MGYGSSTALIKVDFYPKNTYNQYAPGGEFKEYNQQFSSKLPPPPSSADSGQERPGKSKGFAMGMVVGAGVTVTVIGATAWTVFHTVSNPVMAVPAAKLGIGTSMAIIKGLMAKGAVVAAL